MALSKEQKDIIKKEYAKSPEDTGSSELQIALITERIKEMTHHMSDNKQDKACRRGLLKLVAQRRSLLRYIARKDIDAYKSIITRLGLKK